MEQSRQSYSRHEQQQRFLNTLIAVTVSSIQFRSNQHLRMRPFNADAVLLLCLPSMIHMLDKYDDNDAAADISDGCIEMRRLADASFLTTIFAPDTIRAHAITKNDIAVANATLASLGITDIPFNLDPDDLIHQLLREKTS